MTTHEYMDALKAALNIGSDYALAKRLGLSQPSVSKWRQGKGGIGDDLAPTIASILNMPVEKVLSDLHAEREHSPELRRIWQQMSQHFARAACIFCGLAALNISVFPSSSDARTGHFFDSVQTINSRTRRLLALLLGVKLSLAH